ncbi:Vesicle-associated membrane protein, putative isoform 2 [Hibiscus syriacus]|uniref:Vesicle-associated membrane protein, putative isoform 2 n=2 Tax=Hibiscus syriacus TaxID=106335 RepID=A0A6A3D7V0_HIBSY|nr:Vesicle-associated membrane protein, putative isoform 2 [Hibiscus syriacus]
MDVELLKTSVDDSKEQTAASSVQSSLPKDVQGLKCSKEMKLDENFEDLKSKISFMDSKLKEAEVTIMKLTQERSMAAEEKDKLLGELVVLKTNSITGRTIQVGFPFFYVCVVAIMSLAIGYLSHH